MCPSIKHIQKIDSLGEYRCRKVEYSRSFEEQSTIGSSDVKGHVALDPEVWRLGTLEGWSYNLI
jgi:hypothetical protein